MTANISVFTRFRSDCLFILEHRCVIILIYDWLISAVYGSAFTQEKAISDVGAQNAQVEIDCDDGANTLE